MYICKIIIDPNWTVKVKSLECHNLYQSVSNMLDTKHKNVSREVFLAIYLKMAR